MTPLSSIANFLRQKTGIDPSVPVGERIAALQKPTQQQKLYSARDVTFNDDDAAELRNILYGEVSNRSKDKRQLESRVIINTVLNRVLENRKRGNNKTVAEILKQPNQYQAYDSEQYKLAKSGKGNAEKLAAIDEVLEELKKGEFEDITNGAAFYIHNDDGSITYDDERPLFK